MCAVAATRILIVDDDAVERACLRRHLRCAFPLSVVLEADAAAEALPPSRTAIRGRQPRDPLQPVGKG